MQSNSSTKKSCSLSTLLSGFIPISAEWDIPVYGIAQNSHAVQAGDVFFACRGHETDGRRYIDEAISKGAIAIVANTHPNEGLTKGCRYYPVDNNAKNNSAQTSVNNQTDIANQNNFDTNAKKIPLIAIDDLQGKLGILASRFYNHPSQKMSVIGITGTNGKTSTSQFIAGSLQSLGKPCGVIGTLGYGLFNQLSPGNLTTPDAVALQTWFDTFLHQQAQAVAMEVSSHALALKRVSGIQFSIAVFTNLTRDHLDFHGDMQQYGDAKRKLFEMPGMKQAVINADDEFGKKLLLNLHRRISVVAYSIDNDVEKRVGLPADIPLVYATDIECHPNGINAMIHSPSGHGKLQSPLMGRFNLSNLLAALSVLSMMGVEFNQALTVLNQQQGVSGRLQVIKCSNGVIAVIDYAHTPDALQHALLALREHCRAHLWCVFGCGGDRDRGKRPLMAKIAERYSDEVVITSDNPRHEDPMAIISEIIEGLSSPDKAKVEVDRRLAIEYALRSAKAGDVVLIAGKGHETYQQIGDERLPFNDVEIVKNFDA